jgi:hypothetical protein
MFLKDERTVRTRIRSFHKRNDVCYTPLQTNATQARLDEINCGLSWGDSAFEWKPLSFCKSLSLFMFILTKGSIDLGEANWGFLRITLRATRLFSFIRYIQSHTCNIHIPSVPWPYDPHTQHYCIARYRSRLKTVLTRRWHYARRHEGTTHIRPPPDKTYFSGRGMFRALTPITFWL